MQRWESLAMAERLNDEWQACERQCRQFEAAWHAGAVPVLEDFLPKDGAFRDAVLPELVHIDLEFRLRRRMHARVEEYLQRFPGLRDSQQHVLELIEEEYALRLETEHGLSPTEYVERFPPLAQELERRLSKVRAAKTSLHGDFRLRPVDGPPPVVPGCEILELLGRGGMGVVYKAHHVALARTVAVKLLRAGAGADAEERDRFQTEARAVALLQHSNIVQIHEVGAIDGQPYCLLEFVAGGSLQDKLGDGPMPARAAAEFLEPLARAIHFAHQRGVIHRDVKPGNILLHVERDGTVIPKVTDFGLAKQLDRDQSLTRTGMVVGTAQYMAPEQAIGDAVSPATDVYALGAILYEMLTGRPPLQGTSIYETFAMLQTVDPVPPSRLQPSVPRDLETICLKCLSKSPAQRYVSAADLGDDLKRFLVGEPILARPVGTIERGFRWCRRKPAQGLVLALVLLVIVGITGAGFWYQQQQAKDHADEITRASALQRKRELAAQQAGDALAQGQQVRERLGAELARPGGVFVLINKPAQWDGQLHSARAALDRARVVAAGADGLLDAEVLQQIQSLADRLREDESQRDFALALEKIRLDRSAWSEDGFDLAAAEREYPREFARAGFHFDGTSRDAPNSDHVRRILASPIREQWLASLDDWAYVAWSRGNQDQAAHLLDVARLVDPHPWRDLVRRLPAWNSFPQLEKLANKALDDEALFASTSPQMLHLMGRLLTRIDVLTGPKGKKTLANPAHKKAELWLRRAQQRHLGDFWLNFQLGMVLKPIQPTEAAGFYRTALVVRPHSGAAWNNYGVIMRSQKDHVEALRAFRKAIECEPRNAIAMSNLIPCLHEKSDDAEAIAFCKKLLDISPKSLAALNSLGLSRHALGDYAGAKDAFNQAIAIDAEYVRAWNNLGRTLRAEDDTSGALKAYQRATEVDPHSAIAWAGLGMVHFDQEKWSAAARANKKATECDPEYGLAWRGLGNALRALWDLPGALKAGEKSVELDPNNADSWTALGATLRKFGKLPAAIEAHEKAIAINPKHAPAWGNLAIALRENKDLRGAAAALRKSLEINDKDAGRWGNLGAVLDDLNDLQGAVDAYRRAIALKPNNSATWNNLGVAFRKQRDFAKAAEAFEKSITLNAKEVNPYYELALVYRDMGRFNDGLKVCERGTAKLSLVDSVQLAAARIELTGLIAQDKRLAQVLAGSKTTALEQVALADHCRRYKGRYRDAVRLYVGAFKEQPNLADGLSQKRRFHAACAALLAADGKHADSSTIDSAEQARYREQALIWARADLAQCVKLIHGAKDEAAPARALLNAWAAAPDMAMVRDPRRLEALPPAESEGWRQFWADLEKSR